MISVHPASAGHVEIAAMARKPVKDAKKDDKKKGGKKR